MSSRPTLLGLAAALALACTPAFAQPVERDHRAHGPRDHRVPPPPPPPVAPAGDMPTSPPPPPQVEHAAARAGFVWIGGHWNWKARKWAWIPGHWERERAGKKWQEGRWEHRGAGWAWVDGQWIGVDAVPAVATTPPPPPGAGEPPPPPPGPEVRDHREHHWTLDRPYVSSYWPAEAKIGTKVVVRGGNFPPTASLLFHGTQVAAVKIAPDRIVFRVPPGSTTGELVLTNVKGPPIAIGSLAIVTTGDPEADARRADEERRKAAEAEWAAREKELAKDRAARQAAWEKREADWERTREERRAKREAEIRAKWEGAFLADPDTQAELTLHAQRVADLQRAEEIAELRNDGKLAIRVDVATKKESDRHDRRMAALKAAFASKGGHP